jgi:hypothetical protein
LAWRETKASHRLSLSDKKSQVKDNLKAVRLTEKNKTRTKNP